MSDNGLDERLREFEKRQQLFISQRLEYHSTSTDKKIEDVRDELKKDIAGVRIASETAHTEILKRLEQIESRLG